MRPCLRAIVESQHGLDNAGQLFRQLDRSRSTPIRAAAVLVLLQVDTERAIELRNRPGENYGPARRMFLNDNEPVMGREGPYSSNIGSIGLELFREILSFEVAIRCVAGRKLFHSFFKSIARTTPHEHRNFESLGRIGLSGGLRAVEWRSLATAEWMCCHG